MFTVACSPVKGGQAHQDFTRTEEKQFGHKILIEYSLYFPHFLDIEILFMPLDRNKTAFGLKCNTK